jgi:hypothetical protein
MESVGPENPVVPSDGDGAERDKTQGDSGSPAGVDR